MEQTFFDAQKLVDKLAIAPGQTIADFGAGSGFITFGCARKVGDTGTVYALDVLVESLEVIAARAREQQLFHIKTVRANLEKPNGSTLPDRSCDWVIVSNILFQSDQQEQILKEALRVTKPGGSVCVVEWYPEKMITKAGHYPVAPAQLKAMPVLNAARVSAEFSPDPYHYAIVFNA